MLGTPAYIAPERANGEAFGASADQFALGRTIVAALLGTERLPAWGYELDALPASLPPAAREVVARALALDPADRFPSLAAFEEALAACHLGELAPNVGALEVVRSDASFAWAARPLAIETMGPEIARADYTIDALERAALLPAAHLRAYRAKSGLRTTGFSLYAHTRRLGAHPEAGWLARARHLVVLAPGYLTARECWTELAVALVRDNPDALVVTLDHAGFGDSAFAASPPAMEHVTYEGVGRAALAWTELFDVAPIPTVFLAHSMAATGLSLLPDEDFGPHRARILLTPMFSRLVTRRPSTWGYAFLLHLLAIVLRIPGAYRAFFWVRVVLNPNAAELTLARKRLVLEQAMQLPARAHMQMAIAMKHAVRARMEPLRRTYFVLGANDPEATPEVCTRACQILGVRPERFRWLATGAHSPHLESRTNPEWTHRNRHELVLLVDEALDDVDPSRQIATEFAETQLERLLPAPADGDPPRSGPRGSPAGGALKLDPGDRRDELRRPRGERRVLRRPRAHRDRARGPAREGRILRHARLKGDAVVARGSRPLGGRVRRCSRGGEEESSESEEQRDAQRAMSGRGHGNRPGSAWERVSRPLAMSAEALPSCAPTRRA